MTDAPPIRDLDAMFAEAGIPGYEPKHDQGPAVEANAARYRSTRLADVTPELVDWLWPGRLPRGKLVVLDGDPSVGKSTLMLDLAARITTGTPMPDEDLATVPPADVVLMAAEDGLADTIRPRLDAAGADCARVHHLDAVPVVDDEGNIRDRPPVIPGDADAIEALVTSTGAVLVVVDVLMAYLDGRNNSYRDQDVRGALAPLAAVAERTGATIVVLRHLTKQSGGAALYRGGGSIGIIGAARSALVAAVDPDDENGVRRVLAQTKSNLGPPPPALGYQLSADDDRGCARVEWLGVTAHTADGLVAAPQTAEERSALDEATDWLRSMLADEPRLRSELARRARAEGISDVTLRRAREHLGVVVERDDHTEGRPSTWALPPDLADVGTEADEYVSPPNDPYSMTRTPQDADQEKRSESESTGHLLANDPYSDPAPGDGRCVEGGAGLFHAASQERGICEACDP
ncbi:MAG: AAA family ATPase [Iamia sp.]